ncbi:MAG: hypothetical protein CMQ49_01145 [Gammaproteobacteria bacterium]|nr:hypothetical protein [Gammaproteobacteria bacterium]
MRNARNILPIDQIDDRVNLSAIFVLNPQRYKPLVQGLWIKNREISACSSNAQFFVVAQIIQTCEYL